MRLALGARPLSTPINRARLAAKFSLERLRAQIADLRAQQFPGDHEGPEDWIALLSGLLDTADIYLTTSQQAGTYPQDALNLVQDAAALAREVYHYLVLFEGAGMADLHYAVVPPLQRWFEQLKIKQSTFFRAEMVTKYELRRIDKKLFERPRNPAPSLTDAITNKVKWPFLRVTVPSKAFAIIPHLAIVAHEIGHALYPNIVWNMDPFFPQWVNTQHRIAARLGIQTLDSSISAALQIVFAKWFEELCADAFAYYLTGPAIFFSGSEFSQFFGPGYGMSPTHPANDLRREILFAKLQEGGANSFSEIFRIHTGQVLTVDFNSPLLQATPDISQIYSNEKSSGYPVHVAAIMAELHEAMPQTVDIVYGTISDYLTANAPEAIYTPAKYDADLSAHLKPMLAAIPPIEHGATLDTMVPTEFASILNVGWAVLLTKLAEVQIKVTEPDQFHAQRLERLHSLLLKAVELSEARRLWQKAN